MQVKFKEFFYISNLISLSRIVLIVPIVYLITLNVTTYNLWILGLCVIAALTDILDGYISRKLNMVTELGIVLDPLADKVAMAVILIALVIYQKFHISLVILLMYRDLLIVLIGWLVVKKIDKPIMANMWGKINTILITFLVILFLLDFFNIFYLIILYACYLSILISGISYARIAEKVLFLSKPVKYLYWISLLVITVIVVYFAFQVERVFSPENNSESATYRVNNYQDEISTEIHLETGSGSL
jgi:CDP-diacylglycerol--glycerol-3-phosphate 3-phosphatidyltransferase